MARIILVGVGNEEDSFDTSISTHTDTSLNILMGKSDYGIILHGCRATCHVFYESSRRIAGAFGGDLGMR